MASSGWLSRKKKKKLQTEHERMLVKIFHCRKGNPPTLLAHVLYGE